MKTNPTLAIVIIVVLVLVAGGLYWAYAPKALAPSNTASSTSMTGSTTASGTGTATGGSTAGSSNVVIYSCDTGSNITATFGTNSVKLVLSDGRSYTMSQVQSGSGIRYQSGNVVFSSEGDNAFLTEGPNTTYNNCVAGDNGAAKDANLLLRTFTDQGKTFTFNYPNAFNVSGGGVGYTQDWMTNATTMGLILAKVTIPQSFEPKTNFVDATLTIGTSADATAVAQCLAAPQNGGPTPAAKSNVTVNGVAYTQYVTTDAGAGNLYTTTSYRTVRNKQCYAIEYTIHSSQLANFPPSAGINAFDQATVQNALEGIVHSFKFL